jgi:hypothetical protein
MMRPRRTNPWSSSSISSDSERGDDLAIAQCHVLVVARDLLIDPRLQQRDLGAERCVDRFRRRCRPIGDLAHGGGVEAGLGEAHRCRLDDSTPSLTRRRGSTAVVVAPSLLCVRVV